MNITTVCWLLTFLFVAHANPTIDSNENTVQNVTRSQLEESFMRKLNAKCSLRDNHSCMMLKMIVYMNRMFKKSSIEISDKLKLSENSNSESSFPAEEDLLLARAAKSDDETLGILVAEKIWNFVKSRTLRYKVNDNADFVLTLEPRGNINFGVSVNPQNAIEKGRGRIRNLGPIIAAVATKIGIIGALAFKGLVLLVGKALIVSKVALLLAVIIGLKKLLSKKHVTYEVVAHPHHGHTHVDPHHHVDTYSAGWARALDGFVEGLAEVPSKILDAQDIAYSAQKP